MLFETTSLYPSLSPAPERPTSSRVDISQNECDSKLVTYERLLRAANDSHDLPATRLETQNGRGFAPPLSHQDARVAMSVLWDVYQQCRQTLKLPDKGRAHDDLKSRVDAFMRRPALDAITSAELRETYKLFRTMERGLRYHAAAKPKLLQRYTSAIYVSRALKWQYKASVHECIKGRMSDALFGRLSGMKPGASESFSASLGLRANVVPGVGAGGTYTHDASLSITPTEWVVDASGHTISLAADAELLDFLQADLALSCTVSRADIYDSIEDFATDKSDRFMTWLRHAPLALISKIRDLFSLASTYKRDLERADVSRQCLDRHMIILCGKGIDIVARKVEEGAVEQHDTFVAEVSAGASADIGVSASIRASARKFVTVKKVRMDILSLTEAKPELARRLLADTKLVCNAQTLLDAMHEHVIQSSEVITAEMMEGVHGSGVRDMATRAQYLLEQLSLLKLEGGMDADIEAVFTALYREYERTLRPRALAVHELSCRQSKWQAELGGSAGLGVVLPNGVQASVTYEKVTEDEDPYYCGSFLEVTVSGTVNALGSVAEALSASGVSAGGAWALADIRNAVSAGDVIGDAGVTTTMRFKLKEDGAALMYATRGVKTTLGAKHRMPTPIAAVAGASWTSTSGDVLTIGSRCLDLLVPLARTRIAKPNRGGIAWWNDFAKRHKPEIDQMLFEIARRRPGTTLEADLQKIVREVPDTAPLLDKLTDAAAQMDAEAVPNKRAFATEALGAFMLAYVSGGYAAKTASHWSLSTGAKRLDVIRSTATGALQGRHSTLSAAAA